MTGLRKYERDANIPALCGDPALVPPTCGEVCNLVEEHLLVDDDCSIRFIAWEYARWKPGVSTTTVHSIRLSDGSEHWITTKCYADGKAATLDDRRSSKERLVELCAPLRPAARLPYRGLALSVFPADRRLGGVARLLDPRRTARLLEDFGWCAKRSIRKRRLRYELLRFKPEHRAVYGLQLSLRSDPETDGLRKLAARVLPPEVSRRVVEARTMLSEYPCSKLGPELIAADCEAGLLIESWLELDVLDPSDLASFGNSLEAGELLAQLHCQWPEQFVSQIRVANRARLALFRFDPKLLSSAMRLVPPLSSASPVWKHGDFHPDQLGRDRASHCLRLLDLDELAVGSPLDDLASWIADRLMLDTECDLATASGELLEGYRSAGGERLSQSELAAATANTLVDQAAGALRRLEHGAHKKAARLIALAEELAPKTLPSGVRP